MAESKCPTCGRAETDMTPEQKMAIIQLVLDSLRDWRKYATRRADCIPPSVLNVLKNLFPEGV